LVQAAINRADEINGLDALREGSSAKGFVEFKRAVDQARDGRITLRDRIVFDTLAQYEADVEFQPKAIGKHKIDKATLERMIGHRQN
jgi:hypothetical protein